MLHRKAKLKIQGRRMGSGRCHRAAKAARCPRPQHLARYVEQYVGTEGASNSPTEGFLLKPVFLQRNLKKFRRWQCEQVRALRGEAKSSWKRLMGVESACDVDCRFRLGTHKMVFIVNSEDYMYRRGTLCRAKQDNMELVGCGWRGRTTPTDGGTAGILRRSSHEFLERNADMHLGTVHVVDSSVQRPEDKASAMELSDLIAAELAGS